MKLLKTSRTLIETVPLLFMSVLHCYLTVIFIVILHFLCIIAIRTVNQNHALTCIGEVTTQAAQIDV